jgi:hypothetical protein
MNETATAAAEPTDTPHGPTAEILKEVLKAYLEVYRNHFDLFVKGAAGYILSVGFVAGVVFGGSADRQIKATLVTAVCGGSVIAIIGAIISLVWVVRLEREADRISNALGVGCFPFIGAKLMTLLLAVLAVMFFALAYSLRVEIVG